MHSFTWLGASCLDGAVFPKHRAFRSLFSTHAYNNHCLRQNRVFFGFAKNSKILREIVKALIHISKHIDLKNLKALQLFSDIRMLKNR